jgi:hypothetical protein
MKKVVLCTTISLLLLLATATNVFGASKKIYQPPWNDANAQFLRAVHPSSTNFVRSALGEIFKNSSSHFLLAISWRLETTGSPNALLISRIYENGNLSNGFPSGSAIASSNTVNSTIITSRAWYNFTFAGDTILTANKYYVATIEVYSAVLIDTTANYVNVRGDQNKGSYSSLQPAISYHNSAWDGYYSYLGIKVYGELAHYVNYYGASVEYAYSQTMRHFINWTFAGSGSGDYIYCYNYNGTWQNETSESFSASTWSNATMNWNLPEGATVYWKVYSSNAEGIWTVSGTYSYALEPQYGHGFISGYAAILPYIGAGFVIGMFFMLYGVIRWKSGGGQGIPIGMVVLPLIFMFALLMLYFYMYYAGQFAGV